MLLSEKTPTQPSRQQQAHSTTSTRHFVSALPTNLEKYLPARHSDMEIHIDIQADKPARQALPSAVDEDIRVYHGVDSVPWVRAGKGAPGGPPTMHGILFFLPYCLLEN